MTEKSKKSSMKTIGRTVKTKQPRKISGKLKHFYPKNTLLNSMIKTSGKKPVKRVFAEFKSFTPLNCEYIAKRTYTNMIDFHSVDEGLCVGTVIFNRRTAQSYRIYGIVHKVVPIGHISTKKSKKGDNFIVISPAYKGPGK